MPLKLNNFNEKHNTLHSVTKDILFVARCFGTFPVSGLLSDSFNDLRYALRSPYTIFLLICLFGQLLSSLLCLMHLFQSGTNPRTFNKFLTHAAGTVSSLIIINLGRYWSKVLKEATAIEQSLSTIHQKNILNYCRLACLVTFLGAAVEYYLNVNFYLFFTQECFQGNSLIESYYIYTSPASAAYIPYHLWYFIFMQIIQFQTAFVANFTDVFIVVASFYLTAYFEELNNLIYLYKNKSPSIWNSLRVHYTKLTRLVKLIDDHISPFILYSFGGNMALICVQLFKLWRKELAHSFDHCDASKIDFILTNTKRTLYFNYSATFLVSRALLTALFATRVHTSARKPVFTLYEVPTRCYSNDARRFVEQLHSTNVALSGQHFFYVTRGMILSMIATIFTYELVLLQLSDRKIS